MLSFLRKRERQDPLDKDEFRWRLLLEQDFGADGLARFKAINEQHDVGPIVENDPLPFAIVEHTTVNASDFYELLRIEKKVKELVLFKNKIHVFFEARRYEADQYFAPIIRCENWLAYSDRYKLVCSVTADYSKAVQKLAHSCHMSHFNKLAVLLLTIQDDFSTFLHEAARYNLSLLLDDILAYGVNPNILDSSGMTPLFKTTDPIHSLSFDAMHVLIAHGADTRIKDRKNCSVLKYFNNHRDLEYEKDLLDELGSTPDAVEHASKLKMSIMAARTLIVKTSSERDRQDAEQAAIEECENNAGRQPVMI